MRGSLLLFTPGKNEPELIEFSRPLQLDELRTAVGGDIEMVPGFVSIGYGGVVLDCVAFADEHGKLDHKPLNELATMAWARALHRLGHELHDDKSKTPKDWLVGSIAVVFGDKEFMAEL